MPITIDGTNGITQAGEFNSDSTFGFKNRIINGAMVIDQRNAGASKAIATGVDSFTLDRWYFNNQTDGAFTVQQSSTAPVGFSNSLLLTVTTQDSSLAAGQYCFMQQGIEGFNVADLGWGTANAKTITLSFWVRSSLTGTFGGSLRNNNSNRSYPFTYAISSANTFEYKTITIEGDTTGAWLVTNSTGIQLEMGIGVGSTFSGTAGAWAASNFLSATGATNILGTNGATWYLTGFQLEVGSTATSFDYRSIGTELALCQRYYQKSYAQATVPGTSIAINETMQFSFGTAGNGIIGTFVNFPTTMRADPTLTVYDIAGNSARVTILDTGAANTNNITLNTSNATQTRMMVRIFGTSAAGMCFMYQVSAEL
jgi:hypothetical protein